MQEKYVENFEEFDESESKILKLLQLYPNYFYDPSKDSSVSITTQYVTVALGDEGVPYAFYLLNKSGLPKEIQDALVGGDTDKKTYYDYIRLNDVYGVTSDLKVYYCSGIVDNSVDGVNFSLANMDKDNPARVIFDNTSSSGLKNILTEYDSDGNGELTVSEVKGIKNITIDSSATNLNGIYNLTSLEKLYISNTNLTSLDGLQNCSKIYYIFISDSTIGDYSAIGSLGDKLKYLYLLRTSNDEVRKLGEGLANKDLPNLQYFGLLGYYRDHNFFTNSHLQDDTSTRNTQLTDISPLSNFSSKTKNAIKYLYLNNNDIRNIEALEDFENVYSLRLSTNSLTSLKGLEKMKSLTYLGASVNNLTDTETKQESIEDSIKSLESCTSLYYLRLNNNSELRRISYLKKCTAIKYLFLDGNLKLEHSNVADIASIIRKCDTYGLDASYSLDILDVNDTKILTLVGQTITESQFRNLKQYVNVTKANFKNLRIVDDNTGTVLSEEKLNENLKYVLPSFNKSTILSLHGIGFSDLSCLYGYSVLRELDLRNTKVTTLQLDSNNKVASGIESSKLSSIVYEYDSSSRVTKAKTPNETNYDTIYTIAYSDAGENVVFNDSYAYYTCLNVLSSLSKIGLLAVNNSTDDFSKIEKTLINIGSNPYSSGGYIYESIAGGNSGLNCYNATALSTLEKCKKITYLQLCYHSDGYSSTTLSLDFSKCTSLTGGYYCQFNIAKITLPKSYTSLSVYHQYRTIFDFDTGSNLTTLTLQHCSPIDSTITNAMSKCSKLTTINITGSALNSLSSFNDINSISSLKKLNIQGYSWIQKDDQNYSSLSKLNTLNNSNIKELNIYWLPLKNLDGLSGLSGLEKLTIDQTYITDISGISNLTNLNSITITNSKLTDISKVKNLTNLTYLNFGGNFISTGIHYLLPLINLKEIRLNSNSLSNYDTYKDFLEDGTIEDKTYSVLGVFKYLNINGSLEKLNISSNTFSNYNDLEGTTLSITK